ncbi:MAG: dicarboxylate/amino acid:cation symporter [Bacteroidales bacterium]|nr:dicarboxylate/amino acid:cation symporter [Bacteroidales bacterium]MDT8432165.1 dicarboxylate/amino acid:cation symporter [Bacteroidales bacterium]
MGVLKSIKQLPLWVKIFIGMGLGILMGLVAVWTSLEKFTIDWIKPWGNIFLKLLKLIAVPLIFVSLVKGISSLSNISKLSRIGLKAIVIYLATTLIATTIGLGLVNLIQPGNVFPEARQAEYRERFLDDISDKQLFADEMKDQGPLYFFEDMIPENIVFAAGDNSRMLQIIFFAILFAIALVLVPEKNVRVVKQFFDGLNDIILKIIDLIMRFAPIGVFALMAGLIVDFSGDSELFSALGMYMLTAILGLMLLITLFYPLLIRVFAGIRTKDFFRGILPAQLVAFSTSSSAATLPVTLKQVTNEFRVSRTVANFVLPVGVTINMDGTSCYQAVAAVFIAQVFGMDLTLSQQLSIVLLATLASIGSPGVPGGSIVMLIVVLTSVGIPVEGLALILGVDRPIDMLRTVVNITGDSTVASIVAKSEGDLGYVAGQHMGPASDQSL